MLQAHFVYLLSQTWGQPFICKALIPFSGKWTELKHSTQFATGWLRPSLVWFVNPLQRASTFILFLPSLFCATWKLPLQLTLVGLWVCLDYFFFVCFILDSFYCCAFEFTNLILQCLICHLSHPRYFSSLTCCFSSQKFSLGLSFSSSFIEI